MRDRLRSSWNVADIVFHSHTLPQLPSPSFTVSLISDDYDFSVVHSTRFLHPKKKAPKKPQPRAPHSHGHARSERNGTDHNRKFYFSRTSIMFRQAVGALGANTTLWVAYSALPHWQQGQQGVLRSRNLVHTARQATMLHVLSLASPK